MIDTEHPGTPGTVFEFFEERRDGLPHDQLFRKSLSCACTYGTELDFSEVEQELTSPRGKILNSAVVLRFNCGLIMSEIEEKNGKESSGMEYLGVKIPSTMLKGMGEYIERDTHISKSEFVRTAIREKLKESGILDEMMKRDREEEEEEEG